MPVYSYPGLVGHGTPGIRSVTVAVTLALALPAPTVMFFVDSAMFFSFTI